MDNTIQILLALIFYGLMYFFYTYSQGKYNIREEKREKYNRWVEKNGERCSKSIKSIVIIFTLVFLLNLIASI